VGIALNNHEVFSHGQLYTALSRVRKMEDIRVLCKTNHVLNIVWKEVLEREGLAADPQKVAAQMGGYLHALWDEEDGIYDGTEEELMPDFDFHMDFDEAERLAAVSILRFRHIGALIMYPRLSDTLLRADESSWTRASFPFTHAREDEVGGRGKREGPAN